MKYEEALTAVNNGQVAWRTSWPANDAFIKKTKDGKIQDQGGNAYPAPSLDKSAMDWQTGSSRTGSPDASYHGGKDQDPSKVA